MLGSLVGEIPTLVGVDIDGEALVQARRNHPDVTFVDQTASQLPFSSDSFDAVVLADVLEHVGVEDQEAVMAEVRRILRRGGLLVLTVPYAGFSAMLDPMDIKRRLPSLYLLYGRITGHMQSHPHEHGHRHLDLARLRALLVGCQITSICFCGFLEPLLFWMAIFGERMHLPARVLVFLNRLRVWESGVPYPRQLAYNVRLTGRLID